jgi:hypothetical protein
MSDQWTGMMDPRAVSPNPLANLEQTIREHWEEARPNMVARLKQRGIYDECIRNAARSTEEAVLDMQAEGASLLAAWEAVRTWYAILPTEEDDPTLERGEPDTWETVPEWEDEDLDAEDVQGEGAG